MLASWPKAQCVGATGASAFGRTRCSRSALSRAASTRMSAVCTTRLRLRSDRPFTFAQRSSSDRYRSSSGRLNNSDDTRPFRSPLLTSTFQPPARAGSTGFRTSTTPIEYLPRQAPGAILPTLNLPPENRHGSHSQVVRGKTVRDAGPSSLSVEGLLTFRKGWADRVTQHSPALRFAHWVDQCSFMLAQFGQNQLTWIFRDTGLSKQHVV